MLYDRVIEVNERVVLHEQVKGVHDRGHDIKTEEAITGEQVGILKNTKVSD